MQTATAVEHTELPAMVATLCSYEDWFGPYHPQTLRLTVLVAEVFWRLGDGAKAKILLDRTLRNLAHCSCSEPDLKRRALAMLQDLGPDDVTGEPRPSDRGLLHKPH